jgi:hypothetical protein
LNEMEKLFNSIANTIKTYRQGELAPPSPAHVERWANQFTSADRLSFLREFDHVIRQTFLTQETVKAFLDNLLSNTKLVGANPSAYWARANFLKIQKAGQSQKEMMKLFAEGLAQKYGLKLANCGTKDGDYIYLDDVLFAYSDDGDRRFRFIVTGLERGEVLWVNDNSVGHDGLGVGTGFGCLSGTA